MPFAYGTFWQHLQDFAARGKHAPVRALILLQGVHELDFLVGILALAGRRIDEPPPPLVATGTGTGAGSGAGLTARRAAGGAAFGFGSRTGFA